MFSEIWASTPFYLDYYLLFHLSVCLNLERGCQLVLSSLNVAALSYRPSSCFIPAGCWLFRPLTWTRHQPHAIKYSSTSRNPTLTLTFLSDPIFTLSCGLSYCQLYINKLFYSTSQSYFISCFPLGVTLRLHLHLLLLPELLPRIFFYFPLNISPLFYLLSSIIRVPNTNYFIWSHRHPLLSLPLHTPFSILHIVFIFCSPSSQYPPKKTVTSLSDHKSTFRSFLSHIINNYAFLFSIPSSLLNPLFSIIKICDTNYD